jgi:predicted Zn-dependent protease with MMP-like domain
MSDQPCEKTSIEGVAEYWLRPTSAGPLAYRPAIIVECTLKFRSLRAGLNHSEERNYTAWIPEGDAAIDWDVPAERIIEGSSLATHPEPGIPYRPGCYRASRADFDEYISELTDKLARMDRLEIFCNDRFGLYSSPGDSLEGFLARVAEAALEAVEPELKQLYKEVQLKVEQLREAHTSEDMDPEKLASRQLKLFESSNRLAKLFSTNFPLPEPHIESDPEDELDQDLKHIEREAYKALRGLYHGYLEMAREYDILCVSLQPDNIKIARSGLLWVPVAAEQ